MNAVKMGVNLPPFGAGGEVHGDAAFRAVGVPYRERGRRTDAALEVLPGLVSGKPTMVDGEEVTLACVGVELTVFDPDLDPDGRYAAELTDTLVTALR